MACLTGRSIGFAAVAPSRPSLPTEFGPGDPALGQAWSDCRGEQPSRKEPFSAAQFAMTSLTAVRRSRYNLAHSTKAEQIMNNLRIVYKVGLTFLVMIVIAISANGYIFENKRTLEQTSEWTDHTYQVLQQADRLQAAMVDQETGFRGYLITGNSGNLDPYKFGHTNFLNAFETIKSLTADNAAQQRRLDEIRTAADQWRSEVAERGIQQMASEATREAARDLERTGAGKKSMDGIRALIKDMKD
eukprot:gene27269-30103_t